MAEVEAAAGRAFTTLERQRAFWLNRVRGMSDLDRGFVARMARISPTGKLTEADAQRMHRLAWKHRRRIPRDLAPLVEPSSARRFGGDD